MRIAELAEDVPVRAAGRERERPARRGADEPPLRVEHVEEREEIVLVGAAAMQQHERAVRLSGGRADEVAQAGVGHGARAGRGSGRGVKDLLHAIAQVLERRRQRRARSPRCAGSSSVAKPGPSVAISKSTPLGSRK